MLWKTDKPITHTQSHTVRYQPSDKQRVAKDIFHRVQKENALVFHLDDFLAVRPVNWRLNRRAKEGWRGKKSSSAPGWTRDPSIKVFFKLILIEEDEWNWQREMKASCVCLCFLSRLLRFFPPPHQGTRLAVSKWAAELGKASVSIYPHHYPHLPLVSHTHRVQALIWSTQDDTLTSGKCAHVITQEQEQFGPKRPFILDFINYFAESHLRYDIMSFYSIL